MKLNWAERLAVNNPLRPLQQRLEMRWFRSAKLLNQGSRILEIGCGRGAGAGIIIETFRPALFHALDLDVEMVRRTKRRVLSERGRMIGLSVANVIRLPFRDGTWDAVFGFGVLHHVLHWRDAVGEIARVLKGKGVYFLEELYPSLYQNLITRHILLHPREDRFGSDDLREALRMVNLPLRYVLESRELGVLGVAIKHPDERAWAKD